MNPERLDSDTENPWFIESLKGYNVTFKDEAYNLSKLIEAITLVEEHTPKNLDYIQKEIDRIELSIQNLLPSIKDAILRLVEYRKKE